MKLIDGKKIAERIKDGVVREVLAMNDQKVQNVSRRPGLAIIKAGNREDSNLYIKIKQEEAKKTGIDTHLYKLEDSEGEEVLIDLISHLNQDEEVDAILVQLPLPEGFDTDKIISSIKPEKDADCFHPENQEKVKKGESRILPPVFGAVQEILEDINFDCRGKSGCVIGNSAVFGENLCDFLSLKGLECRFMNFSGSKEDIAKVASRADLLISAVGKPGFVNGDFVKQEAVVIDVGIVNKDGKVAGDVEIESAGEKAAYLTPVPGGVGPITVAMLLKNTLELHKHGRAV
ncbi:MAG: bifunctional 5,10-methylenetetrahydrofolate dehydrogenase/5,10-methenyltetrahydrofolate cyclohydrolase [Candidatus Moranbacteria bacterium]|nr:bifunctional 5,10-methylenetetrahydrofolate dehydrogenase/5,10-methenyltetrahydrofolate cyclohydrolase [Candidatus Moranbacteria bacterium]